MWSNATREPFDRNTATTTTVRSSARSGGGGRWCNRSPPGPAGRRRAGKWGSTACGQPCTEWWIGRRANPVIVGLPRHRLIVRTGSSPPLPVDRTALPPSTRKILVIVQRHRDVWRLSGIKRSQIGTTLFPSVSILIYFADKSATNTLRVVSRC